jgi:RNA polymerase sigma factor (sigma-70 family)
MIRRGLHSAPATTDPELMARLAAGDIGALGELYDRHRHAVRRFVARATSNAEDVDDLVHGTFLTAVKSAGRYDGRESARPWLIGVAVQLLRRRRRSFGRWLQILGALNSLRPNSEEQPSARAARGELERALARLSEAKRLTILLAEVEGWSCQEIAGFFQIPIGTVWTRLHAARRELRRALQGEPEP